MSNKKHKVYIHMYINLIEFLIGCSILSFSFFLMGIFQLSLVWLQILGLLLTIILVISITVFTIVGKIEVVPQGLIVKKKLFEWATITYVSIWHSKGGRFANLKLKGKKKNIKIVITSNALKIIKKHTNSQELLKMMADADIRF